MSEEYDSDECPPNGCFECEDGDCPRRNTERDLDDFNDCPYTGEECIREFLRANTGCIGCEIQDRPTEEELATNESHESTVDLIRRYRDEYAEQGNEEATK